LFKTIFKPYKYDKNAPKIIKKMCDASKKFDIGPMSAVAGTIAYYAVKEMIEKGATYAIVDNGGDIAFISDRTVHIGIYTGNDQTGQLAFEIKSTNKILGVCTSSGKIGHSFSYGNTDASIIFSEDLSLADAAATALGNQVKNVDDVEKSFTILNDKKRITAALVFFKDKIGLWGDMPSIVPADVPYNLITRGRYDF